MTVAQFAYDDAPMPGMTRVHVWAWKVCPKCKSPYWNRPRRMTREEVA